MQAHSLNKKTIKNEAKEKKKRGVDYVIKFISRYSAGNFWKERKKRIQQVFFYNFYDDSKRRFFFFHIPKAILVFLWLLLEAT